MYAIILINEIMERNTKYKHPGKQERKTATSRSFQKAFHRSKILDLILTHELISRTDLARETGLSQASVTGLTADLIAEGLIEERKAGAYEGGRRPTLLAFRADGVHAIGVNMAMDQIRVVIVNLATEVKASHKVELPETYHTSEQIVDIISQAIQACMWEANYSKDQIAGVGIGVPGPVDANTGMIHFLPNYGWREVPFKQMLEQKINHPVFIDNSSNNLAIGEYWFGEGKGLDNFLVITLENGVGAGLVTNGQLVRGAAGIAGEFGHICISKDGPKCRCGRQGCIEAYVGNNAIVRDARQLVESGQWSDNSVRPEQLNIRGVFEELAGGNDALDKIYERAGEILGFGIFNMVTMINPEVVIITGKGVNAGEKLFAPMRRTIAEMNAGQFGFMTSRIVIQTWSDDDWARESGALVLREIYKSPLHK